MFSSCVGAGFGLIGVVVDTLLFFFAVLLLLFEVKTLDCSLAFDGIMDGGVDKTDDSAFDFITL